MVHKRSSIVIKDRKKYAEAVEIVSGHIEEEFLKRPWELCTKRYASPCKGKNLTEYYKDRIAYPKYVNKYKKGFYTQAYAKMILLFRVVWNAGFPVWKPLSPKRDLCCIIFILCYRLCPEDPYGMYRYAHECLCNIKSGVKVGTWKQWKSNPANKDLPKYEPRVSMKKSGLEYEKWMREWNFEKRHDPVIRNKKEK